MAKVTISGLHTDQSTNKLVTIEFDHHRIHDGSMFSAHYVQEVTDTDDRSIIAFTTPADKEIHLIAHVAATAAAVHYILEGAVGTALSATDLTVYNKDRNSDNTSLLTSIDGTVGAVSYYSLTTDTGITGGTVLYEEYIGAGKIGSAAEGSSRGANEWILKKSTVYDIELKSLDANTNQHHVHLDWYEHTNKYGGI